MLTPSDFEDLATQVGVADFDLMLVGDGSGMSRRSACGWFCNVYWRPSRQVTSVFGGASHGTNNFAELTPYLHALWTFHAAMQEKHPGGQPATRVLIVTDSELTVRCGTGQYKRNANLALWAGIDWYESVGYDLIWRHVPRNSNPLSKRADVGAGRVRLLLEDFRQRRD